MRILDLGTLAAVAAGTSFPTRGTGFLPGEQVVVNFGSVAAAAFAGSAQVQTSVDGTTWGNVGSAFVGAADTQQITLSNFIRLNCTARTAGSVKAVVVNEIG
jgi:hypothetical protein